jgi:hypothetical protein
MFSLALSLMAQAFSATRRAAMSHELILFPLEPRMHLSKIRALTNEAARDPSGYGKQTLSSFLSQEETQDALKAIKMDSAVHKFRMLWWMVFFLSAVTWRVVSIVYFAVSFRDSPVRLFRFFALDFVGPFFKTQLRGGHVFFSMLLFF